MSTHSNTNQNKNTKPATLKTKPVQSTYHRDKTFRTSVICLLVVALLMAGGSLTFSLINFFSGRSFVAYHGNDGNSANFTEGSIADVAAKVTPGVVSILTETRTTNFFGQTSTQTSAGTGMIVSNDGYILTNQHIVSGAKSISVVLDDGTTYQDVSLVTIDPFNDVAFLKIADVANLPTVTLGDSKTINAGQQVIAIGNALGQYQNTITSGIISGTGRSLTAYSSDLTSAENLTDMIQTDAAINAGNSGGPLVNAAGEVIGINTATSSDADGIGFAIPISSVKGLLKNLIANGSTDRSYLGIRYINLTPDLADTYNLPVTSGAYLFTTDKSAAVIADSPAAKAGLRQKDIITKVNDVAIGRAGSVSTLIGEYAPGDTVKLTIIRDGEEQTVNVTLGSYSDEE